MSCHYIDLSGEGVSPMALISIQSGWDGDGKHCNLGDGSYTNVETVIMHNIRNWIIEDIQTGPLAVNLVLKFFPFVISTLQNYEFGTLVKYYPSFIILPSV